MLPKALIVTVLWSGCKVINIFAAPQMPVVEGLTWTLPAALGVTVIAAQLEHRVPCWGYVLQEHDPPARPNPARLAEMRVSAVRPLRPHGHMTAPWRLAHTSPDTHKRLAWLHAYGKAICEDSSPDIASVVFIVQGRWFPVCAGGGAGGCDP